MAGNKVKAQQSWGLDSPELGNTISLFYINLIKQPLVYKRGILYVDYFLTILLLNFKKKTRLIMMRSQPNYFEVVLL